MNREYPNINAENIADFFGAFKKTYPLFEKNHINSGWGGVTTGQKLGKEGA
ncbi:protein of unknown function [Xenorhabdus doucetiae]|uniref:Uncharacterized protein n=1 Tax=Xenorhabdus doucetiae TaxID=351671 RepID=A0A068QXH7_9GAMM|nr:protein of unknown function [Xenorhabdus doucetiae]